MGLGEEADDIQNEKDRRQEGQHLIILRSNQWNDDGTEAELGPTTRQ